MAEINTGNNQIISHAAKINDLDLPKTKEEGEYVYDTDWNAVVSAIKILNANTIVLAETINKHNALDTETLTVASKAITDASILTQHLADAAVTGDKIANDTISNNNLANACIKADNIDAGVLGALCSAQLKDIKAINLTPDTNAANWIAEVDLDAKYNVVCIAIEGPSDYTKAMLIINKSMPNTCWIFGHSYEDNDTCPVCGPYTCVVVENQVITPFQVLGNYSGLERPAYYPLLRCSFGAYDTGLVACYLKDTENITKICFHIARTNTKSNYSEAYIKAHIYAL